MCYLKAIYKSTRVSLEVKRIINGLKSGELEVRNVPKEFALDSNVFKSRAKVGVEKKRSSRL